MTKPEQFSSCRSLCGCGIRVLPQKECFPCSSFFHPPMDSPLVPQKHQKNLQQSPPPSPSRPHCNLHPYGSRCLSSRASHYLPLLFSTSAACLFFVVHHISSMASLSLAAGPTDGEGSPPHFSGAANSSNIYIKKKTKYPFAL